MTASRIGPRHIGLLLGPLAFALTALTAPPGGMGDGAWLVAGLTLWMAAWWMTEAVPLAVTAVLPFVILPLAGVSDAETTASTITAITEASTSTVLPP